MLPYTPYDRQAAVMLNSYRILLPTLVRIAQ